MQKIPTMFERDESTQGHPVTDHIKAECRWVLDGEGVATRKIDGTNVKIAQGVLYKRQKPKERDYDDAAYVLCDRNNPADKWAFEAFDAMPWKGEGIYELVGPKIQGNPQGHTHHELIHVVPFAQELRLSPQPERTFAALKAYLADAAIEGIVFHHPDRCLAKIKRRDFGLPWPAPDRKES